MSGLLFNFANLISGGSLKHYKKQAKETQATLQQTEQELQKLKQQYNQLRAESDQNYAASIQAQEQLEATQAEVRQQQLLVQSFQEQQHQNQAELEVALASSKQSNADLEGAIAERDRLQQQWQTSQAKLQQSQKELENLYQQNYQLQQQLEAQPNQLKQVQTQSESNWRSQLQTSYHIEVKLIKGVSSEQLLKYNINQGTRQLLGSAAVVKGLALGKQGAVKAVRIVEGEQELLRIPVELPRPNITKQFAHLPYALNCGFECAISLVGIEQAELVAEAVLADNNTVAIAEIKLQRADSLSE